MMTTFRSKPPREKKQRTASVKVSAPKDDSMRLNKYVAHCGICSRREAAELVKKGLILVNKQVELNPSYIVQSKDKIFYQGNLITPEEKKVYILINKPKNTVTTSKDEKNRKTVLDMVSNSVKERVYPVGRLDRNTTGLLLLTNDGELSQKLAHPSFQVKKIYHVVLHKNLSVPDFQKISEGLILEDGKAKVDGISYVDGKKNEIGIEIHSGKNRIIRRIFEHLNYQVEKLDRVYYAGLTKKNLPRGKYRHLTSQEVINLKHFLK
ncbi:MAG: rRNA pseudouridine synthase [Saprospiraceae bacterium]|jgi:23S rRNA pseudouridine2605 synthase|nr:rRNA pseudouridine synthase [Saprospiraceae bacterium]